jgi:ribosome biogenesis GTPase A
MLKSFVFALRTSSSCGRRTHTRELRRSTALHCNAAARRSLATDIAKSAPTTTLTNGSNTASSDVTAVKKEVAGAFGETTTPHLRSILDPALRAFLAKEKATLTSICEKLLDSEAKESDLVLLRKLIAHLDDLFLLVVVGEFNSGKTSLINTLLGKHDAIFCTIARD